jgi:hypothetical protein
LGAKLLEHTPIGPLAGLAHVVHDDDQACFSHRIEVRGRPAGEQLHEPGGIGGGGSSRPESRLHPHQFVRQMATRLDPPLMAGILLRNEILTQEPVEEPGTGGVWWQAWVTREP